MEAGDPDADEERRGGQSEPGPGPPERHARERCHGGDAIGVALEDAEMAGGVAEAVLEPESHGQRPDRARGHQEGDPARLGSAPGRTRATAAPSDKGARRRRRPPGRLDSLSWNLRITCIPSPVEAARLAERAAAGKPALSAAC